MSAPTTIHAGATTGFSDASTYDAPRPAYPPEAVQGLLERLGVAGRAGARLVDAGAGTGKFTEGLAARGEGFDVVAVEPLAPMRATLAAKRLRGVDVREGTAERMVDVEDGWADAVVVAQAFHWFATEEALREIHRVLKPGGKLAMIWNAEDYNKPAAWPAATAWGEALNKVVFDLPKDGQPRFRDAAWPDVFDGQTLFSTPLGEEKTPWTIWLDLEALYSRVMTLSQTVYLDQEQRAAFKARLEGIEQEGDAEWNEKREVAVQGVTFFAWTTRL